MQAERRELIIAIKKLIVLLITCILSLASAGAATEQEIVNQSASILRDFRRMPEKGIPNRVLRDAKGLAGASLEGAVIATQKTANARYYGRPVRAIDILTGRVAAPARERVLRAALSR